MEIMEVRDEKSPVNYITLQWKALLLSVSAKPGFKRA